MRIRWDKLCFTVTVCILCLLTIWAGGQLQASPGENQVLVINSSIVNVRTGPGLQHSLVTKVKAGDKLPLIASEQDWHQVTLPDGREGWVANWLGEVRNQDAIKGGSESIGQAIVQGNYVNIRSGPGLSHTQIHRVHQGEKLVLLAASEDWYQVKLAGERTGWIASWLVELLPEEEVVVPPADTQVVSGEGQVLRPVAKALVDNLNVRGGAGTSHPVQVTLNKDDIVPVLEQGQDWFKVELADGGTGWVASWLVELGEGIYQPKAELEAEPVAESGSQDVSSAKLYIGSLEVQGDVVNLRSGADASFDRVDQVNKGRELLVLAEKDGWYQVELGDDQKAWIIGQYVTFNSGVSPEKMQELKHEQIEIGLISDMLVGKLIVLDPGHGGLNSQGWNDPGAIGPTGLVEREVVLDIAQKLKPLLEAHGAQVIMTRTGKTTNLTLQGRGEFANEKNADIFVSIHANASLSSWQNGTMVFYYANGPQETVRRNLAQALQTELVHELKLKDMGVRQNSFSVLRSTLVPSALVEVAFLSNPAEEKLLGDPKFRQRTAEALSKGIIKYFSSH